MFLTTMHYQSKRLYNIYGQRPSKNNFKCHGRPCGLWSNYSAVQLDLTCLPRIYLANGGEEARCPFPKHHNPNLSPELWQQTPAEQD